MQLGPGIDAKVHVLVVFKSASFFMVTPCTGRGGGGGGEGGECGTETAEKGEGVAP